MSSWAALEAELDAWADVPGGATFWWRDDDLSRPGPACDRMLALAERYEAPLLLAVIPARLSDDLAPAPQPEVWYAQHGWAHEDHAGPAAPGERRRKIELGGDHSDAVLHAELRRGWQRLRGRFGPRLLPVMVPPWNRIAAPIVSALPGLGYAGLSAFGARAGAPGLTMVNVHVDVIDWRGSGGFAGEAAVLEQAMAHLAARRAGSADRDEPTGLMTHHAVHDPASWAFLAGVLEAIAAHPHARLVSPQALFPAGTERERASA